VPTGMISAAPGAGCRGGPLLCLRGCLTGEPVGEELYAGRSRLVGWQSSRSTVGFAGNLRLSLCCFADTRAGGRWKEC
jgi:hypothetical protein